MRTTIGGLDPRINDWQEGQMLSAHNWSAEDWTDTEGNSRRTVYHYSTRMVEFVQLSWMTDWSVDEDTISLGWGSVSDQNGMNNLIRSYGFRYRRDERGGGPRVESLLTGQEVA